MLTKNFIMQQNLPVYPIFLYFCVTMAVQFSFFRLLSLVGCMLLLCLWSFSCRPVKSGSEQDVHEIENTCSYFFDICIDSLHVAGHTIKQGDHLSAIFSRLGLSASQSERIYKASADHIDPKKLQAGLHFYALTTRDSIESIHYIIFAKSRIDYTVIDLTSEEINVYPYQKPITRKQKYISGSVATSLWNDIIKQGANSMLALHLADIFAWQINFFTIKEKDSFRILYTESFVEDTIPLNIISIDGAIFMHDRKTFTAIPFMQDSIMEYFDDEAQSLRKAFLKAPLDFFRITSRFTNSRFHPILRINRAHHGVDYAAPAGTPVKSIGSGKVVARGYEAGGGGNYVRIQHNSVYTTVYMHLRGFAPGIQTGRQVQQGEIIGYVGSTGLSTGPHLDFRVYKNGTPIDPLTMESPPSHPVKPELLDSFNYVKQQVLLQMDEAEEKDAMMIPVPNE
jgi:murein DD-endopeptidase MepM/ murein hydrolase activator NlpD